jgi:phage protein D
MPVNANKKRYSPKERYDLANQYIKLDADKKSEFLRKFGLYQSDMNRWLELIQEAAIAALSSRKARSDKKPSEQVELEGLKKKLAIQDKKITKLDALLGIQKKVLDILGTDKDE